MDLKKITARLLTEEQILEEATRNLGLNLVKGSFYYTTELETYDLTDQKFVDALIKAGFKINNRVDNIITLSDENPQLENPGWAPSNYWNFRKNRDKLILELRLICRMSYKERGVVFFPYVQGSFLSPSDILPSLKVFKVVAKYNKYAKTLINQVAKNEKFVVSFKHIGLAGIKSLAVLFEEFRNNNDKILQLAHSEISPFNPNPCVSMASTILHAPEDIQALVFEVWEVQLREFRAGLKF